jgi:hypothetical protein
MKDESSHIDLLNPFTLTGLRATTKSFESKSSCVQKEVRGGGDIDLLRSSTAGTDQKQIHNKDG